MTHTPGPWHTGECTQGGLRLIRPGARQESLQIVPAEDAVLIASAPEMLAALKAIIALPAHPMRKKGVAIAEAVVAKLEGRV